MTKRVLSILLLVFGWVGCGDDTLIIPKDAGSDAGSVAPDMACVPGTITVQVNQQDEPFAGALLVFNDPDGQPVATVLTGEDGLATASLCQDSSVTLAFSARASSVKESIGDGESETSDTDIPINEAFLLATIMNLDPTQTTPYVFNLPKLKSDPLPPDSNSNMVVKWRLQASEGDCSSYQALLSCPAAKHTDKTSGSPDPTPPDLESTYCVASFSAPSDEPAFTSVCLEEGALNVMVSSLSSADDKAIISEKVGMESGLTATLIPGDLPVYAVTFDGALVAPALVYAIYENAIPGIKWAATPGAAMVWDGQVMGLHQDGASFQLVGAQGTVGSFLMKVPATPGEPFDLMYVTALTSSQIDIESLKKDFAIPSARHGYFFGKRIPYDEFSSGTVKIDLAGQLAMPSVSQPTVTRQGWPARVHLRWSEDVVAGPESNARSDVRVFFTAWLNSVFSSVNGWIVISNASKTGPTGMFLPVLPEGIFSEYLPTADTDFLVSSVGLLGLPGEASTDDAFRKVVASYSYNLIGKIAQVMINKAGVDVDEFLPSGETFLFSLGVNISVPETLLSLLLKLFDR